MPINTILCPTCSARINYVVSNENLAPTVECRRCGEVVETDASQIDSHTQEALDELRELDDLEKKSARFYTKIQANPEAVEQVLARVEETFDKAKKKSATGKMSDYIVDVSSDFGLPEEDSSKAVPQEARSDNSTATESAATEPAAAASQTAPTTESDSNGKRFSTAENDIFRTTMKKALLRKFTMDDETADSIADFFVYLVKNGRGETGLAGAVKKYGREYGYTEESIQSLLTIIEDRDILALLPKRFRRSR